MLQTAPPVELPGYRLTQPLGEGGFGRVWEALDADGRLVALKFVDCRARSMHAILGEVKVLRELRHLSHPHIIELYGVQTVSHYLVLIMERADGNLADLHKTYQEITEGHLPAEHALELLGQAAEALDFLASVQVAGFNTSSRGVQHCDIKPTNLLVVGETLKVADFGLVAGTAWQTHKKGCRGTPPYAAPELYNGSPSATTDQYALAITFCELCAGERPFWNVAPSSGGPMMPVDLSKVRERELPVLLRALHPHPSSRWPSCRAFIDALREAVSQPRAKRR